MLTASLIRKLRSGRVEWLRGRAVYAQPRLHKRIKALFRRTRGVFFEVGANDGLDQSNTAYLERYEGWHGILVEPIPTQYARCVANRPASKVINAALVAADFPDTTVELAYANLMSTVNDAKRNLLSVADHIATGGQFLNARDRPLLGQQLTVPALTVSAVLDMTNTNQIDFFSLDVEGYELEVLKGIDFSRHQPRYLLIEARQKDAVDSFLRPRGYRLLDQWSEQDFLFTGPS